MTTSQPALPTRSKFLEHFTAALIRNQPWAADPVRRDRFLSSLRETLQGKRTVNLDGDSFREAWRECGLKGKPTYKLMHQFPE